MLRWQADDDLCGLIRRYYAGEAGLWLAIRDRVDAELRARGVVVGAYHIRLRRTDEGYEVVIEDAAAYAIEP
jgi:hypothetical protein